MIGVAKNSNGPHDLTIWFAIFGLPFATVILSAKFEVYLYQLQRHERRYKMSQWGCLGQL